MKNSPFLFGLLASVVLCSFLCFPNALAAGQHSNKPITQDQRAANAKQQLLRHQHRLDAKAREPQSTSPSANPSGASISINKQVSTSSTFFFHDDLESGTSDWTIVSPGDSAAWHLTTHTYSSWSHSWHAGIDNSNYQTGARVYDELVSPPINLSGAISPVTLLFSENYLTEQGWDFCMVDVTTDGGTSWTHLRGGYGESVSGDSHYWKISSLDLTQFANQTINIRFVFDTGDSLNNYFEGWYIDDITVFDQSARIAGIVYYDQNQNGTFEPGETGIGDWPIQIHGPISDFMVTPENGRFSIPVPLGSYQLIGGFPFVFRPWRPTTPETLNVDMSTPGQLLDALNFGYYRPGCIVSGIVFKDLNHNGVYNNGEPAFTDPVIELEDANFNWVDDTHADSTGQFSFLMFVSGQSASPQPAYYHLAEYLLPANWVRTVPSTDDPYPGQPPTYGFSFSYSDTLLNGFDFGGYESPSSEHGAIRGFVFNDLNQDGVQDNLEPMISHSSLALFDSMGVPTWARTDTMGRFSFENLTPGRYKVRLIERNWSGLYGWQQSMPTGNYPEGAYIIQLASDEVRDSVVFGTYHLPVGTVRGNVFYDMNRNGVRDPIERTIYVSSVTINTMHAPDNWSLTVQTDVAGDYEVDTLPIGLHTISIGLMARWRSIPRSPISFTLTASETDTFNWGVYSVVPGSINGSIYNDINGNGSRDSGESPFKGVTAHLDGRDSAGSTVGASTTSDDSGRFRFDGVWSGRYTVRIAMTANWRQTQPSSLRQYTVSLGDEDNQTGFDFGVVRDSTFNLAFRSFLPESIAYAKDLLGHRGMPVPCKPYATEETFTLVAPVGGLDGLHIEFNAVVDAPTLTATGFPPPTPAGSKYKWEFKMNGSDTLDNGDTVVVFAHSSKIKKPFRIRKYWWEKGSSEPAEGTPTEFMYVGQDNILYPMPNLINVIAFMYNIGFGSQYGLSVGLPPGPHSVGLHSYSYVWKSLIDAHGNTHIGSPRCLDVATSRKMTSKYPPTLGNNILFAEALALKASIAASDLEITPYGFGSLIFHGDSINPFNGLSVRGIAAKLDTAMSQYVEPTRDPPAAGYCVCDSNYFNMAYLTIRMIDSAFSGPLDTIGRWGGNTPKPPRGGGAILLKPVRPLSDVPFLTLDSAFSSLAADVMFHRGSFAEEPLQYKLEQNYPNPFNPTTTLSFTLAQASFVTLKIYNIIGQEMATLVNREQMDGGLQKIEFNASSLSSGVYFYHIVAEGISDEEGVSAQTFTQVKKMVLLK